MTEARTEDGEAQERGRRRLPRPLALVALAGLVLAAAWPALSAELVYDDLQVIRRNPRITSLANWPSAFSATYWEFLEPEVAERIGYWRPLATLTHMLVYVLSEGAAEAFHTASVAVHLLAVLAAFRLARRLTGSEGTAFFTALIFGLHPINVESWAWVSALNGVLAGLFSLLALDAHLGWRRGGSRGIPWRAPVLFALALLAKETAVAVLPLAAAIDLAAGEGERLARRLRPFARAYAPLLVVLGGYWLARVAVFGGLGAGVERVTTDFGPDVDAVRLLRLRIEILGGSLVQGFAPDPTFFRPFRPVIPADDPRFLRDLAVLAAALLACALALRARARVLAAALVFPLLALVPVVVRVSSLGSFPLSDRFVYVASFGIALLVAHAAASRLPRAVAYAALAFLAGIAGVMARERADVWRNELSLFRAAVEDSPESPYVRWGLGRVLLDRYQRERDPGDLRAAQEQFDRSADLLERALAGDSSIFATVQDAEQTNVGLGWCYLFEAELTGGAGYATAEKIFEAALRRTRASESAATGLGAALQAQGRYEEAEDAYRRALEVNPRFVEAHHNLATLYLEQRDWPRAQRHVERALELRPDHFRDVVLLARILFERGYPDRAREAAERARRLDPTSAEPLEILAVVAGAGGDGKEAMRILDEALRIDPGHGRIHYLRANEFLRRGDAAAAIESLRRACDLMPGDFASHHDLGALLLQRGAVQAALPFLTRAYELCRDDARLELMRRTLASLELGIAEPALAWARADRRRGDREWVARWADAAVAADPSSVPARMFRAAERERRDDLAGAEEDLARAVEAAPEAFEPRAERGRVLAALGREEEARAELERAREIGPPEQWEAGLAAAAKTRVERLLGELEGS